MIIHIYADGAVQGNGKEEGGVMGMGAVLLHLSQDGDILHEKELSWSEPAERATNNRAELLAIRNSVQGLKEELRDKIDLTVVSDSEWSIMVIEGKYKASVHLDLIGEIRTLFKKFKSAKLQWVKGHNKNAHNESADRLAFHAARPGV